MKSDIKSLEDGVKANCEAEASAGNGTHAITYGVSFGTLEKMIAEVQVVRAYLDVLNQGFLDPQPLEVSNQSVSFVLMDLHHRLGRLEDTLGNVGLGVRS